MKHAMNMRARLDSLEIYEGQQERESRVIFALFGMVAELILDLDITAARARELFTLALFERAQERYGSNTRVSLAFDSALRTVKKIKSRLRKQGLEAGSGNAYNLRRKVYLLLMERERNLSELAAELPINFEVNYARLAVDTLRSQGLVKAVDGRPGYYQAVLPDGHLALGDGEDEAETLDGFRRYLSGIAGLAKSRLLGGSRDESMARYFVARVRRDQLEDISDRLRAAVIKVLMEAEVEAQSHSDGGLVDLDVMLGALPGFREHKE